MFNNIPPNGFPQIPDIEDLEAVVEDVKTLKTTAAVHAVAITGLENNKDDTTNIAPTFSADSNYSVGDLVYYEGTLYECTTAHEAAAWDAEDFTAATIAGEINGLNSKINGKVVGTISGTNVPCIVESAMHYTDDNAYNVWTSHTFTFTDMTNIAGVFLQVHNNTLISDGIRHEVELMGVSGNVVTYAVKGAWSGGAAGVNVSILAVGA